MDKQAGLKLEDFLFPSRLHDSPHLGVRPYARIFGHWVDEPEPGRADYDTHSMRRTKGDANLQVHQEPACYTTALGGHRAEVGREVPQHRGR